MAAAPGVSEARRELRLPLLLPASLSLADERRCTCNLHAPAVTHMQSHAAPDAGEIVPQPASSAWLQSAPLSSGQPWGPAAPSWDAPLPPHMHNTLHLFSQALAHLFSFHHSMRRRVWMCQPAHAWDGDISLTLRVHCRRHAEGRPRHAPGQGNDVKSAMCTVHNTTGLCRSRILQAC